MGDGDGTAPAIGFDYRSNPLHFKVYSQLHTKFNFSIFEASLSSGVFCTTIPMLLRYIGHVTSRFLVSRPAPDLGTSELAHGFMHDRDGAPI